MNRRGFIATVVASFAFRPAPSQAPKTVIGTASRIWVSDNTTGDDSEYAKLVWTEIGEVTSMPKIKTVYYGQVET